MDTWFVTDWLMQRLIQFLPVFMRVLSFVAATPVFRRNAPPVVIVGLSGLLALLVFPLVPVPVLDFDFRYAAVIVQEIAFGLLLGLVVTSFLYAVYIAGQLMDVPMGFGMVNILDPQIGMDVPVMAQFHFVFAILLFFFIDGHHTLLRYLAVSFDAVPVAYVWRLDAVMDSVLRTFSMAFYYGFRIALPVMSVLFLTDVLLGILARAVPQINVFFVGFPIKATLGFIVLMFALPAFVYVIRILFLPSGHMFRSLQEVIRLLAPQ